MFVEQISAPRLDVHLCNSDAIVNVSPILMFACSICNSINWQQYHEDMDSYWDEYNKLMEERDERDKKLFGQLFGSMAVNNNLVERNLDFTSTKKSIWHKIKSFLQGKK